MKPFNHRPIIVGGMFFYWHITPICTKKISAPRSQERSKLLNDTMTNNAMSRVSKKHVNSRLFAIYNIYNGTCVRALSYCSGRENKLPDVLFCIVRNLNYTTCHRRRVKRQSARRRLSLYYNFINRFGATANGYSGTTFMNFLYENKTHLVHYEGAKVYAYRE